jgi:hypothetical protein
MQLSKLCIRSCTPLSRRAHSVGNQRQGGKPPRLPTCGPPARVCRLPMGCVDGRQGASTADGVRRRPTRSVDLTTRSVGSGINALLFAVLLFSSLSSLIHFQLYPPPPSHHKTSTTSLMSSLPKPTSEQAVFLAIVKEFGTNNWMEISCALMQQGYPKREVRCLEMWYDTLMEDGHQWDWYETKVEVEVCSP